MNKDFKLPDKIFGLDRTLLVLFLAPFSLVIIFLVSLNLVLIPKVNKIEDINKKIDEVNNNTKGINEQIEYLASVDQDELQRDADYLNNAVLKDKKSYLLVGIIRRVAEKYNYQIESFSLVPGELKSIDTKRVFDSKNIVRIPISLVLYGPRDKGLEFISAMEKTLPVLFIDEFKTQTSGDNTKFSLMVSSYYIKDEVNIDANKVALSELILTDAEAALVQKISEFTKIEDNQFGVGTAEFQQYQRDNPFSL